MKLKRFIILFFFILLTPLIVKADNCDINADKISIDSVTIEDKSDNVTESDETTINGKDLNLNLIMHEVGDNAKYKIILKNESPYDYELNNTGLNTDDDYINYNFSSEDESNIIKANTNTTIYLNVEYKNELPDEAFENDIYNDNKNIKVSLSANAINPETKTQSYILLASIILITSGTLFILLKKNKCAKYIVLIIGTAIAIPLSVYALCKCDINIESNIKIVQEKNIITYNKNNDDAYGTMDDQVEITNRSALILSCDYAYDGFKFVEWNTKADGSGDSYNPGDSILVKEDVVLYAIWEEHVTDNIYWALQDLDGDDVNETLVLGAHEIEGNLNGSFDGNAVYTSYTQVPWIHTNAWDEANYSRYVTTVNVEDNIYPASTAYWFAGVGYSATSFIADLNKLHTDYVTNMKYMFLYSGCAATTWELNGLNKFNTSNVTDMSYMFDMAGGKNGNLDLTSFDTSNVENMTGMFYGFGRSARTYEIKGLEDFDVSKVKNMSYMFNDFLTYANNWSFDFSKWNTESLENMYEMFDSAGDYAGSVYLNVTGWDTSKVTSFSYLFREFGQHATSWSIIGLNTWDTSSVTQMVRTFADAGWKANTFNIDVGPWNTSSVTDMYGMFDDAGYWADTWDVGNINSWNVSNVTDMGDMFSFAGGSEYTFKLNLSSWNTSSVKNMSRMFDCAGNYSRYVYIDISGFNMSNVTNISDMFGAYFNSRYYTWSVKIPRTNGAEIENTTTKINGKNVYFDITNDYTLNDLGVHFTLVG